MSDLKLTKDPVPIKLTRDQPEAGGRMAALWQGLLHGVGNAAVGMAQLGARAPTFGFEGPPITFSEKQTADVAGAEDLRRQGVAGIDRMAQQREAAYQTDPTRRAHPGFAAAGRIGGELLSSAPLMAVGGGAGAMGRMAAAPVVGAISGMVQPVTGGNFATEKLKQAGLGAAGGLAGGALGEVVGSTLGRAIAGNTPQAVDAALTRTYRHVVKPSRVGQQSAPQLAAQDRQILSAVDDIIGERAHLQLTGPAGNPVSGELPRSLRQFSEAIDHTKRTIFREYDQMAQQAGQQGARVDLSPAERALRAIAARPEITDFHPGLVNDATALADNFAARGSYSAEETQDIIQNLNRTLSGLYSNPTHETVSRATMLAPIVRELRRGLDQAVEQFQGPGYQALRNRYGALVAVEKNVAGAVQREANKIPGGIGGIFTDLAASEEAIRGVITMNPAAIMRAGGIKAAQAAMRYIHSPNRAIERLFARRQASMAPTSALRQSVGAGIRGSAPAVGAIGGSEISRKPPSMEMRLKAAQKVGSIQTDLYNAKRRGDMADVAEKMKDLAAAQADYKAASPRAA